MKTQSNDSLKAARSSAVRRCAVCGLFYPSDAGEIRRSIDALLEQAGSEQASGTVRGLIAPHAGYQYSGLTAANAFARVRTREYKTVIIIAPSHREYFDAISVFPGGAYETPLGIVPVDTESRERLLQRCRHSVSSLAGHGAEHAIEVELPFLQSVLNPFQVLPVVMGDQRREYCIALGDALAEMLTDDTLVVASSDLSHYHASPAAETLDQVAINDVRACDPLMLMADLEAGATEACGGGPMVAAMTALRACGIQTMDILHHCNSGDITGERQNVVGYLAASGCVVGPS